MYGVGVCQPRLFYIFVIVMETAESTRRIFESYLQSLDYSHEPDNLYAPVRYVLSLGGKRIRPVLLLMAYNLYCQDLTPALTAAAGIEIFHNFTLLHDDVMDRADMRRGKPTVHVKWNENVAILSGDAMTFVAYKYLANVQPDCLKAVLDVANETFLGVTDGQQYDMDFETRNDVSVDDYMEMIRLKTSVLLAAALEIGSILGHASDKDRRLLYEFGEKIGLAFQLQDDLLDVYGDPKVFGKNIGGDIMCNKKTFMYINARNLASDEMNRQLDQWEVYDGPAENKIKGVTAIYDALDIRSICQKKIDSLFDAALKALDGVSVAEEKKTPLKSVAFGLMNRNM